MTDRFAWAMPFGAAVTPDGVRFRLWAPGCEAVELQVEGATAAPMRRLASGWFELVCETARAGNRYRFRLPDGALVPDPASRQQVLDPHGPSVVVDPCAYHWQTAGWRGRPWEETILYELHVGAFTAEGSFDAVRRRLDHLEATGITAIELMPLAEFAGSRGWGYDGVLPFAPQGSYGTPEDLKFLVDAIHARGMMAFLDVVYNHLGPEGNYLGRLAPAFFTAERHTPWGAAIDFGQPAVRDFYRNNAMYWLEEYRFDGLRFDAIHAIEDPTRPDFLTELTGEIARAFPGRHIHLVAENDRNEAHRLGRGGFTAQWNDDFHHAAHVVLTGERASYYADYADAMGALRRCLVEGFAWQGEPSPFRGGAKRGESSTHLPPTAFVTFLQNHDQIGNRALGDRLARMAADGRIDPARHRALLAILLLAPHIPLLFMGEEWGAAAPFPYFCDFQGELARLVREGRRTEFKEFAAQAGPDALPDPAAELTFHAARLDWSDLQHSRHEDWLGFVSVLLRLRQSALCRRLAKMGNAGTLGRNWDEGCLEVRWVLGDGAILSLAANLGARTGNGFAEPPGELLFDSRGDEGDGAARLLTRGTLPAGTACWFLADATEAPA